MIAESGQLQNLFIIRFIICFVVWIAASRSGRERVTPIVELFRAESLAWEQSSTADAVPRSRDLRQPRRSIRLEVGGALNSAAWANNFRCAATRVRKPGCAPPMHTLRDRGRPLRSTKRSKRGAFQCELVRLGAMNGRQTNRPQNARRL